MRTNAPMELLSTHVRRGTFRGLVQRYVAEYGHEWTTHPNYGVRTFPDREIRHAGVTVVSRSLTANRGLKSQTPHQNWKPTRGLEPRTPSLRVPRQGLRGVAPSRWILRFRVFRLRREGRRNRPLLTSC